MEIPANVEQAIAERLSQTNQSLASAESCTGGLIAHRITNIAGSSAFFLGGLVAYSNEVKMALLGVPEIDLAAHGAVSGPVARQMAAGARERFEADLSIAVTGIAGPGGGTEKKPVGLVYIAVGFGSGCHLTRNVFSGSRTEIKEQTAQRALEMLWERIA